MKLKIQSFLLLYMNSAHILNFITMKYKLHLYIFALFSQF